MPDAHAGTNSHTSASWRGVHVCWSAGAKANTVLPPTMLSWMSRASTWKKTAVNGRFPVESASPMYFGVFGDVKPATWKVR